MIRFGVDIKFLYKIINIYVEISQGFCVMLGPTLAQPIFLGGLWKSVSTPAVLSLYHRFLGNFSQPNLLHYYSSIPSSSGGGRNSDMFTRKLQEKTERELEELVEQRKTIEMDDESHDPKKSMSKELGGPKGPEPTRFGDWERAGRCSDF